MENEKTVQEETRQGEKTFTQEDVNRIVQERLARVKAESGGRETELDSRERELDARERRMNARDILAAKNLPAELLEVLDCSDEKRMQEHIKILEKAYMPATKQGTGYSPRKGSTPLPEDPVREAMGLK